MNVFGTCFFKLLVNVLKFLSYDDDMKIFNQINKINGCRLIKSSQIEQFAVRY